MKCILLQLKGFSLNRSNSIQCPTLIFLLNLALIPIPSHAETGQDPEPVNVDHSEATEDPYQPEDFLGRLVHWWKKKLGQDPATIHRERILSCSKRHAESCLQLGDGFLQSGHLVSAELHFNLACSFGLDPGCQSLEKLQARRRAKEDSLRAEIKPARKSCLKKSKAIFCSRLAYIYSQLRDWKGAERFHKLACEMGEAVNCAMIAASAAQSGDQQTSKRMANRAQQLLLQLESSKRKDFGVLEQYFKGEAQTRSDPEAAAADPELDSAIEQ